jgi:hypothetical protein
MTTADIVREKALSLARTEIPAEEANRELLASCRGKRVPIVLARQQFLKELEEGPSDPVVNRAVDLLDQVLKRLPLA